MYKKHHDTKFWQTMSKQNPKLKVVFSDRVLHTVCPTEHYYVITHCDKTGMMRVNVDRTYDVSKVDWDVRDEVYVEWIADSAGKYHMMLTCPVGVEEDAKVRREVFLHHAPEVVNAVCMADAVVILHCPELMNSCVSMCLHDGYDCSDVVELGMVKDHAHSLIKK